MITKLINQIKNYAEIMKLSPNEYLIKPKSTMRATTYQYIQETPNLTVNILGKDNFNNPLKYIITDNNTKIDHIFSQTPYNEKEFEKACNDITNIFEKHNLIRPHIIPYNKTLYIEIGEDTFHNYPFPLSSAMLMELDKYMDMYSEIYITNNSLRDNFLPNIIIEYKTRDE